MYLGKLLDPRNLKLWGWPRKQVEAAFIPGRAKGNWEISADGGGSGLLAMAAAGFKSAMWLVVVVPGSDGSFINDQRVPTGYPGWEVWKKDLLSRDVFKECILKTRGKGLNTRTETDDFVLLAKENGWKTGVVIMNQHETLRVMLGALKSFESIGYSMKLYPFTPANDWNQKIYGSQGQIEMPRAFHILEELRRVAIYQEKGDLASFEELEAYYKDVLGIEW